jgi:hypothetical protein
MASSDVVVVKDDGSEPMEQLVYVPTTTKTRMKPKLVFWKVAVYSVCVLFTTILGYVCGNTISHQISWCGQTLSTGSPGSSGSSGTVDAPGGLGPTSAAGGDFKQEKRFLERVTASRPTTNRDANSVGVVANYCPNKKEIPLSGGIGLGPSLYLLNLCKGNQSWPGMYDELSLRPAADVTRVLAKWQGVQWVKLAERIRPCHPYQRGRCRVERGEPLKTCPHAARIKGGLYLCFDQTFRVDTIRVASVELNRLESVVFLEACLFWRP